MQQKDLFTFCVGLFLMLLAGRSCGEDASGEEDVRAAALEHGVAADMLSPARGEVGGRRPSRAATDMVVTPSRPHMQTLCGWAAEYLLLHMVY